MNMNKSVILLLAIIILTSGCVYSNNTTDVSNLQPIVNNTDLGSMGTGERVVGTKYHTNETPINVIIITHTVNTGVDVVFNFSINDVEVWSYDKRTAIADEHHSMFIEVPKNASYELNASTAIHHIEWREYPYK